MTISKSEFGPLAPLYFPLKLRGGEGGLERGREGLRGIDMAHHFSSPDRRIEISPARVWAPILRNRSFM